MKDLRLDGSPPMGASRPATARYWLDLYNGAPAITYIIEALVRPVYYTSPTCDLARTVGALNEGLRPEGLRLLASAQGYRLSDDYEIELPTPCATDALSSEYLEELSDKCESKLAAGDLDGAITNARTLLEEVLGSIEQVLTGARGDYGGDLPRQYKAVAKRLRIDDERKDLDENFKSVARGLTSMVNALAPIRNKMSDGHARERKPAEHHARLVVNASKTVASFMIESYRAQRQRGLLPGNDPSRIRDHTDAA